MIIALTVRIRMIKCVQSVLNGTAPKGSGNAKTISASKRGMFVGEGTIVEIILTKIKIIA